MMIFLSYAASMSAMKTFLLTFLFLSLTSHAQIDIGGVPGTANQVEKDPAQRGFEKEYDELEEVMQGLDEPQRQTEKESDVTKPTHEAQTEPHESRAEE